MTMQMPAVKFDLIHLKGGWDQKTPTLDLPSGYCKEALNFECSVTGGYSRIAGYERYDGQAKPSDAVFKTISVVSFATVPTVGTTVSGATSGATGVVIATAADYIVITKTTGTFSTSEVIMNGLTVVGTAKIPTTGVSIQNAAIYTGLAADQYRANITAVPGSGPTIGCTLFNDVVYALRANVGGTAVDLYKSTVAGWVQVPFFNELSFTAGTTAPADGATITQGAVTATIRRVMRQSGAWTGSAAGRFIVTNPVGGNFVAGAATIGATTVTLSGVQTAITMAPGGKMEWAEGNFAGGVSTARIYGCDSVNRAFEFDGITLAPIVTGTTPDAPKHISVHKNYLFISVQSALVFSAPGLPYDWTALSGAGVIGVGQNITGLCVLPGAQTTATLLVTSRENTFMLYGIGAASWNLVTFNTGAGALDYTIQNMAQTYWMDDRGVVSLQTSLNYGNFDQSTLTANINKFIEEKRTRVTYSTLDRRRSQYRVFFNDGTGLYLTSVNGQVMGSMPVYFPNPVYMADERKYSDGSEASFFCSTNGFVYQMDKGTSFDGVAIDAYITLNYNSSGSARIRKRYRKCALEMSSNGFCQVSFGYLLGYSSTSISQALPVSYSTDVQVMQWDNFTWDNFTWDGRTLSPTECEMTGTAENVAIVFRSSTPYYQQFTINSAIVHYSMRRAMR